MRITKKQIDEKAIDCIVDILNRGNSVEIRLRKDEVIIQEIAGKLKYRIEIKTNADGQR